MTFELVAERGTAPDDLDPVFASLDKDPLGSVDGVRDQANMPAEAEPERVRRTSTGWPHTTSSEEAAPSSAFPPKGTQQSGEIMDYRLLGRTGVEVSPLCLGTMMFGEWGNQDVDASTRIIRHALDSGINFVDTADVYSAGGSEEIVGKALKGRRDDVVLATKFFMPMGTEPNRSGGSRKWIMQAVEGSLRRLGTDYLDLYQVHRPSPAMDVEETLGALTDLVRQGKVRYIGSSSYSGSQIVEAQVASRDRNLARFVTEQPPYSILVRGIEQDVLPTTHRHGMGTLTYSPLAGGWLSGKWRKDAAPNPASAARPSARFDMTSVANQHKLEVVDALTQVADEAGTTVIELAIAFVINHPAVTSAIIGPRTMEQLESQLPAADVKLSPETLDRIDELVAPGVTINPDDNSYGTTELAPTARRR
jgi:aryl-alcohol dehydrogenase-like predicted oxidoreductase